MKTAAVTLDIGGENHDASLAVLRTIDWDFAGAKTDYLTHPLHPYPAKFIPQIPNALIQELSSVGDTVLDPFCGSGTTLVEALALKRHAVGLDANPIACLISKAKTIKLDAFNAGTLQNLRTSLNMLGVRLSTGQTSLFDTIDIDTAPTSTSKAISFWFDPQVIHELARIKDLCYGLTRDAARTLALAVFSSVIVSVSRQDSDTRYVRRSKKIQPGETTKRFTRALDSAVERAIEFTDIIEDRFTCRVIQADALSPPTNIGPVDLVVCSPPYPNAYSYHLYHRTRMLWLDMDPVSFKKIEIGSHRKYSSRSANGATANTFKQEMTKVFSWLRLNLRSKRFCCFVIGDSILKGTTVNNHELIKEAALSNDFRLDADILRRIQDDKKSFNPRIGHIRHEHVLIFRNGGYLHA